MFNDKEVAKEIDALMRELSGRLNTSLWLVKERCSNEEFLQYKTVVGQLMGEMFCSVKSRIYELHPDLTPEYLKDDPGSIKSPRPD
jgi:hypothetical protein